MQLGAGTVIIEESGVRISSRVSTFDEVLTTYLQIRMELCSMGVLDAVIRPEYLTSTGQPTNQAQTASV